jgi:hypothetical protein
MRTNIITRCRLVVALGLALLLTAADARANGKLVIGNQPLNETAANYQQYIKFLTVPPAEQIKEAFKGNDINAIRAMEHPLRRQIFDAMNRNSVEQFTFANLQAAQENFTMRLWAIGFMLRIEKGAAGGGVDFNYTDSRTPAFASPQHWQAVSSNLTFRTKPGARPSEAMDAIVRSKFRGECLAALEITVLYAARQTLGAERFNKIHGNSLSVGPSTKSAQKHTRRAPRIRADAMIPGDWVYMKNKDDYNKGLRPGVKVGYWTGENAIYMGRYDMSTAKTPVYRATSPARYSGMGVYHVTQREFQVKLKQAYQVHMTPPNTFGRHTISDADIRWTHVARLVASM